MSVTVKAQKLAAYMQSLPGFVFLPVVRHSHMGGIIVDALLQAGVNFDAVKDRVEDIRQIPQAETTTGFLAFIGELESRGESLNSFLRWEGRKPRWVKEFVIFLYREGVETDSDLREWFEKPQNLPRLFKLNGFGNKTVDYLKGLVGISSIAVDRHWYACLDEADVSYADYEEARAIAEGAAGILGVDKSVLDTSLWAWWRKNRRGSWCS